MLKITKKYEDSQEHFKSRLQEAVNNKFWNEEDDITYWVHATYPDAVIIHSYKGDEYFEVPYIVQNDEILLGEPKETHSLFSSEQIINQMKQGKEFIVLNNKTENPVYRVLVQTNNELPAHDMGFDKIKYSPEAQKEAIGDLLGEFVYDDSQSNHQRLQNPKQEPKKFAKVIKTGYCPEYGAYTDWEVFDHDYVEIMNQLVDSKERNIPIREGPSTEVIPTKVERYDTNSVLVTKEKFNGITWVKNPRDAEAGICQIVNNLNLEDINMSDNPEENKIEVNKEEYEKLKADKEAAENEVVDLKAKLENPLEEEGDVDPKVAELESKLDEANSKIEKMEGTIQPLETQINEEKAQVVNSLLDVVPEADKTNMKTFYEGKDLPELKILQKQIVNSMPEQTNNGIVDSGTLTPPPTKNKITFDKFRATRKTKRF
ncbi:hypothetical protein MBCUT_06770 [Methanobrevibacter cuticularis]|uniref:Uncharacterized protein n=1 Tax=Methanobrevibacter cuticularis TaxID=47311 RepID=A0A166EGT3_9EURY|nr:hypothetical protein [Methanobrevibacter cuticularis]KZX16639.1 hypothetical protein MBCUT_06770 [Methanobrevibacter cuticularis]